MQKEEEEPFKSFKSVPGSRYSRPRPSRGCRRCCRRAVGRGTPRTGIGKAASAVRTNTGCLKYTRIVVTKWTVQLFSLPQCFSFTDLLWSRMTWWRGWRRWGRAARRRWRRRCGSTRPTCWWAAPGTPAAGSPGSCSLHGVKLPIEQNSVPSNS